MQLKLYPKNGDLYKKLRATFGDHPTYTSYQVSAIIEPKKKLPMERSIPEPRKTRVPVDAFTKAEVQQQLLAYEKTHPDLKKQLTYTYPPSPSHPKGLTVTVKDLYEALQWKYGNQHWYLATEIRDVEQNGIKPLEFPQIRLKDDPVRQALDVARREKSGSWTDFKSPRIRQNWRDVLYDEDPSQEGNASKAIKDLVGATFSYSHDANAGTDTWTAIGAVIFPWQHNFADEPGLLPAKIALAPSVSIYRVDTNGDPKVEADSVLYRFGAYADWVTLDTGGAGIQSRAAFVYATNTGHDASLSGFEVDIEPRWQNPVIPIGFKRILWHKAPLLEDGSDQSLLDYQVRVWLHTEGGDVQDTGKSWDSTKGSFFRLGPTAQLQLRAPRFFLGKDFSITMLYSHLPAVSGSQEHQCFFKLSAVYDLVKDEQLNHKVSLTAEYQKGGLNLTKEDVDTFTLGLGVLF
jgi:hypothetical protein